MVNPSQYVIINNRAYDPVTGLPVGNIKTEPHQAATQAESPKAVQSVESRGVATPSVHRKLQKSITLSRRYVKKPHQATASKPTEAQKHTAPQYSPVNLRPYTTPKSEAVKKFSHQVTVNTRPSRIDRPAETHPVVRRASHRSPDMTLRQRRIVPNRLQQQLPQPTSAVNNNPPTQAPIQAKTQVQNRAETQTHKAQKQTTKPAHIIKNEAIYKALNTELASNTQAKKANKERKTSRWGKFMSLASASLAIVLLAGYFTYLSMPNISIRMAAVQSGVNAKYPSYRPDGYALNGPISFKDGEVSMRFAYAGTEKGFTLTQQRSNWDSAAVKHHASTKSDDTMITTVDGLTIYTYGNNATWVNGGVLYTMESDAPLSSSQIQRVATSM